MAKARGTMTGRRSSGVGGEKTCREHQHLYDFSGRGQIQMYYMLATPLRRSRSHMSIQRANFTLNQPNTTDGVLSQEME